MSGGKKIKVAGYAQRVFFDNGIEYRNFNPDLVGAQITSQGGTPLFTMGNFAVTTNIDPKPDKVFNQGTFSQFLTLDDVSENDTSVLNIEKNLKTQLNLDITDPLQYVWYGSFVEFNRVCLEDIQNKWPAAIYVDNKVGSVTGDSVTNYSYDIINDVSTFKVNSKYFFNPFSILYTTDSKNIIDEDLNSLRNLTLSYGSYNIEKNGKTYKIVGLTGSTQKTNSEVTFKVDGNVFNTLTKNDGSPLYTDGSLQFFIKPNEKEIEGFFSSLNDYQKNLLNRNTYPKYKIKFTYPVDGVDGNVIYQEQTFNFPITKDGYNLNFFDGLYLSFLTDLNDVATLYDNNQTNLMVRKYTSEVISSFDTFPRADGDDLTNNGQKATNILHIYGREFDEVKKYITGIKYAHVVTYNKKNNTPDVLVKDLANMLGFDSFDFLNYLTVNGIYLPSYGVDGFSGQSKNYTNKEIEIDVYRKIILNIAWLWKSKGTRKAIEFLFRLMGAPESVVVFDEHVYVAEKPIDIEAVKRMLYLYTGSVDVEDLPFDDEGYPLPPKNTADLYFESDGGWYRETGGDSAGIDTNRGNNPHVGSYDGGNKYISQFTSTCFLPDFNNVGEINVTGNTLYENIFYNYNDGYFNGITSLNDLYVTTLEGNNNQLLGNCFDVSYDLIDAIKNSGGTTNIQDEYQKALDTYNEWTKYGGILQQDPHLYYSPEWRVVKHNYDIAKYKLSLGSVNVSTDEKCLSITLTRKNIIEPTCENFTKVEDGVFIYYLDSNGKKTLFDDFPKCCVADGGVYKTFINPTGREACYCAKSSPCSHGKRVDTTPDGIVVFETGGGNNLGSGGTNTTSTYTTISSPECCVWNNYSYTINSDGDVVCVDTNYDKQSAQSGDNVIQSINDKILQLQNLKETKESQLTNLTSNI